MSVTELGEAETSLAARLLLAALQRSSGSRIRSIAGSIVDTAPLDRDSLQFHFKAHARGTPAEGAELVLELVLVVARCDRSGHEFRPAPEGPLWPCCGFGEAELLRETGVHIRSIEVE